MYPSRWIHIFPNEPLSRRYTPNQLFHFLVGIRIVLDLLLLVSNPIYVQELRP